MKHFYKITFFCCAATLWMLVLASCEGGELYDVNAPEWISDKIQEIEDSKKEPEDEILEGMQEDVYTIGNTDFTSGFWAAFSKYYVIPDGEKWNAVFNLNINPVVIHITRTLPLSSPMMWNVAVRDIPNMELSALMLQVTLKLITLSGAIILTSSTYRAPCFLIPLITKTRTYKSWVAK